MNTLLGSSGASILARAGQVPRPGQSFVDKLEHNLVFVLDVLLLVGHVAGDDVPDIPLLEEPDHELSEDDLYAELLGGLAVVEEVVEGSLPGDHLDVRLQQRLGQIVEFAVALAEGQNLLLVDLVDETSDALARDVPADILLRVLLFDFFLL